MALATVISLEWNPDRKHYLGIRSVWFRPDYMPVTIQESCHPDPAYYARWPQDPDVLFSVTPVVRHTHVLVCTCASKTLIQVLWWPWLLASALLLLKVAVTSTSWLTHE